MRFHHNNNLDCSGVTAQQNKRAAGRDSAKSAGRHTQRRNGKVRLTLLGMAVVFTISCVASMFGAQQKAYARDFNAEIKALQNQINDLNQRASDSASQADTLQNKINELQSRQDSLQAQINLSTTEREQLEQQIAEAEAKIKKQTEALAQTLQDQYYSGQTSSLDILMNSKSVSDYVDRQTRQQAMSDQISSSTKEIQKSKADLETKKVEVEKVIDRQNKQKAELASAQNEQRQLLEQTRGEEAEYKKRSAETQKKMEQVKSELEAANRVLRQNASGGSSVGRPVPGAQGSNGARCGGGYPTKWCNAGQDTLIDSWGMFNRECVSYAAFRVANDHGYMPYWGGQGMAYQWYSNAMAAGYKITTTPAPGTVAWRGISGQTPVGHVGFVESVNGNKYVVSEYNATGNGTYRKYEYTVGSGFTHFLWISM